MFILSNDIFFIVLVNDYKPLLKLLKISFCNLNRAEII